MTTTTLKTLYALESEVDAGRFVSLYDGYPEPPADWHNPKPDQSIWLCKVMNECKEQGMYVLDFQGHERIFNTFSEMVSAIESGDLPIWMVCPDDDPDVTSFNDMLGDIEIDL